MEWEEKKRLHLVFMTVCVRYAVSKILDKYELKYKFNLNSCFFGLPGRATTKVALLA